MEEEVNNKSKAAENEHTKRITTSKTLQASEDELTKVKADLTAAIRERDSVSTGLASTQKQAEDQTKRLLEVEDQLQIAKDLIKGLNKRLAVAEHDKGVAEYARDEALRAKQEAEFVRNDAEAAKETAEDDGYNAGVAETQATLKAQIPGVCRFYCSQVWEEALKRAGVDASSDLWKAENIFYLQPSARPLPPAPWLRVTNPRKGSLSRRTYRSAALLARCSKRENFRM